MSNEVNGPGDVSTVSNEEKMFLNVEEAAQLLRVGPKAVYEAIRRKQMPGVVRLGRLIRIRRADILGGIP